MKAGRDTTSNPPIERNTAGERAIVVAHRDPAAVERSPAAALKAARAAVRLWFASLPWKGPQ